MDDGRKLAMATGDSTIGIWDAAMVRVDLRVTYPSYSVQRLALSPDGRRFAGGVAFSPDGRRLASSSVDRTVKIWSVAGDRLVADEPLTLPGHTAAVYRIAWSPDGHRLATASRDGTSRIYTTDRDDLVALAHSRVTRNLTTEECQKYLRQAQCPN